MKQSVHVIITKLRKQPYIAEILLACITLLALILRIYRVQDNPVALNQDEAVNGYDAYTLGKTLRDHHGNLLPPMLESFGDWSSPFITYLTIPFVKLFGLNEWSIRLPVVLLGTASVVLMYILIKQIGKRKDIALLGSFILAISPWSITLSRWAIPPSIVPFCVLLLLTFFLWVYDCKKPARYWQAALVGLIAGASVYSYPTMKLFLPLFVGVLGLIFLKNNFKKLIVSGVTFAIIISPIYFLTLTQPETYNARYDSVSLSASGESFALGFVKRYVLYFSPQFLFGQGDVNTQHQVPSYGNIHWIFGLFFYIGLIAFLSDLFKKNKLLEINDRHRYLLLAWLLLYPIAASVTKDYAMLLRVVHGLPLVILFIALGYGYIAKLIEQKKNLPSYLLALPLILIAAVGTAQYFTTYMTSYRQESKRSYNFGMSELFTYLRSNEQSFDRAVVDNGNLPIYYFFFNKTEPRIAVEAMNTRIDQKNYTIVGKYEFRKPEPVELATARKIQSIESSGTVWFEIYDGGSGTYFVVRK